jgi:hypothetical protein
VWVPNVHHTHPKPSVSLSTPRLASPSLHQAAPVSTHTLREYVDASVACPSCGMYGPCGASAPPNMPGTHECTVCRWCDKCCAKKPACGRLEPPSGAPLTEAVGEGWPRAAPSGGGTAVAVRAGVVPVCVGPYACPCVHVTSQQTTSELASRVGGECVCCSRAMSVGLGACCGSRLLCQASGHSGHYRCVAHGYCMTDSSGHFRGRPEVCRTPGRRGIGCIVCPVAGHKWSCCGRDFGDACTGAAGVSSGGAAVSGGSRTCGLCGSWSRCIHCVCSLPCTTRLWLGTVPTTVCSPNHMRPFPPHQATPGSAHTLREYVDASVACPSCGMYGPCGASAPPNMPGTHECTACRWCDKCCVKKPVCYRR